MLKTLCVNVNKINIYKIVTTINHIIEAITGVFIHYIHNNSDHITSI